MDKKALDDDSLALLVLTGPSGVTAHTSAAAGANVTPGELVIDPPSTCSSLRART